MKNLRSSGKHAGGNRVGAVTADRLKFVRNILLMASLLIAAFMLSCTDRDKNPVGPGTKDPDTERQLVNVNAVGKTEDGNEVLVYQKGQLDKFFTRMDMVEMAPDSGSYRAKLYFKDMNPADIPNTGDVIVSEVTEMAQYGFLYRVLDVTTGTDGVTVVEVRTAALTEAIEDTEYEAEIEILFDEEGNVIGALVKTAVWGRVVKFFVGLCNAVEKALKPITDAIIFLVEGNYETDRYSNKTLRTRADVRLDPDVDVRANVDYSLIFNFSLEVRRYNLKRSRISLNANGEMGLESKLRNANATGAIDATALRNVFRRDLGTITLWIGPVPVVINNNFVVELYAGMKAESKKEMGFRFVGESEFGFSYLNGNWTEINRNTFRPNMDGTAYPNGEVTFGIAMGVESKIYSTVGMKGVAGPGLAFTTVANPTGIHLVEEIPNQEAKLDFVVRYYVAATLSRWASDLAYNVGIGNKTFGRNQDWNWILTQGDLYRREIFRNDLMPRFSHVHIDYDDNAVRVSSSLVRRPLHYSVEELGFCLEAPGSDACKRGEGIIKTSNLIQNNDIFPTTATFDVPSDLSFGTYHIRPYFKNTTGGIYYFPTRSVVPRSNVMYKIYGVNGWTADWTNESNVSAITHISGSVSYSPSGFKTELCDAYGDPIVYYVPGTQVTVTATPAEGYVFLRWSMGGADDTNPVMTFSMNNRIQTLPFPIIRRLPLVISGVTPAGGGTVSLTPEGSPMTFGTDQARYYPLGTRVTTTAVPNEGYEFTEWTQRFSNGTIRSVSRSPAVMSQLDNYNEVYTLTANFSRLYRLTTNVTPAGSGTVSVNNDRGSYAAGTQLTITATPAEGYVFTGWQGASTEAQPALQFTTADSAQTLTATFARAYTLTTNTAPTIGGTVSYPLLPGQTRFVGGTNVTVTARPMLGYAFSGWSGASTSTNPVVTVTMDSDKTLTANFLREYTLNIRNNIGGNVSRSPNQTGYIDGTQVTVTALPVTNYQFVGWSGASMSTNPIVTITMNSDKLLEAKFVRTNIDPDKIFTDPRDGQQYRTTKIGTQTWMAENLRYDNVNLRFPKAYIESNIDSNFAYNFDDYGMVYSLDDAATVCPAGWHLPSKSEWELLIAAASGGFVTAVSRLKAESGWRIDRVEYLNGTDDYGFTAFPGGLMCYTSTGALCYPNVQHAFWWTGGDDNNDKYVTTTVPMSSTSNPNVIAVHDRQDVQARISVPNTLSLLLNIRCVQDLVP